MIIKQQIISQVDRGDGAIQRRTNRKNNNKYHLRLLAVTVLIVVTLKYHDAAITFDLFNKTFIQMQFKSKYEKGII